MNRTDAVHAPVKLGLVDVADTESDERFHRSMGYRGREAEAAVSAKVEESRD